MSFVNILWVAAGGALGAVARYGTGFLVKQSHFPYATLLINIIGSFFIGMVLCHYNKQQLSEAAKLLLATGFCGGFTTFSAFSWECLQLLQQQKTITCIAYIALSVVSSLLATMTGYFLINKL